MLTASCLLEICTFTHKIQFKAQAFLQPTWFSIRCTGPISHHSARGVPESCDFGATVVQ
jgi:hypothetical protein